MKVYMDYNATTPLEPEVIQAMAEAMQEAWGNPSSAYPEGRKAKETIGAARESLARMVGGRPQDVIFTSGGTEVNGPHGLSSLAAPTVKSDSGSLLVS